MAIQKVTDPFTIVQQAGDTYQGDASNQIYQISPALTNPGDVIAIVDQGGENTIQLVGGLTIASSVVMNNEIALTLSNGAVVNVRGADTFEFSVGGNTAAGVEGETKDFAQFVQDVLGVEVPAAGERVDGATDVVINEDGGADPVDPEEPSEGDTSSLTEALENLKKAQTDKAEFLEEASENELVAAATGATTEAKIADAVTKADAAVATVSYDDAGGGTQTVTVYSPTDSAGVKAAKIVDAQTLLENNLTAANKVLDTAQANVAKVAGLSSAISLYDSRVATQKETAETLKTATASQAGAVANYDSLNTSTIAVDPTTGAVASVLVVNAQSGRLELASGVTETTNPGVGALLNAVQAGVDAKTADDLALNAIKSAVIAIGYLDVNSGDKDDIGAAFEPNVTAGANSDKLTQAQVQVELNEQLAAAQTIATSLGLGNLELDPATGLITTTDADLDFTAAKLAYDTLKCKVNDFEATLVVGGPDYTFATADMAKAQIDAQAGVESVENAIEALNKALSDLETVKEVAEGLVAANKAIDDAEAAFEGLGVETPVTIDGTVIATSENDLFLMADDAGTIVNFNAQGEDSIYFGSEFGLLVLDTTQTINDRVGDANMFEVFAKQNGANVDLYVEQQTFAGNGATEADIVKVTLTGVRVDELTLSDDGFLTLA